jgi:hypothetical protein
VPNEVVDVTEPNRDPTMYRRPRPYGQVELVELETLQVHRQPAEGGETGDLQPGADDIGGIGQWAGRADLDHGRWRLAVAARQATEAA